MTDTLTTRLAEFVKTQNIEVDPDFSLHHSGVHSVVNCVFSAQARFKTVVEPLLNRLHADLPDIPELTFSEFILRVDAVGSERYASDVLKNRQKLSGRLKVEVARDVADFFVRHRVQTTADFQCLDDDAAETLMLRDLAPEVRGIGPTLAHYLLWLMGREDHVKVDSMLIRLFSRLDDHPLRLGHEGDRQRVTRAIREVAMQLDTTPARLDNALWQHESRGGSLAS
ncbi:MULTISPECIES: hypothetical protein [Deinococcus]|uniref:Uncharacterized protein n=1 Tax=Deinococcus rufus TaxID=2136097 RepID=A0ABV7ZB14_9DEIO|nr:hypothetical protein [Deinococcus sp. AB2017081]WQE95004.1 hypothetical protein U2P90_16675 [Deinococcus sp. AB2017081]